MLRFCILQPTQQCIWRGATASLKIVARGLPPPSFQVRGACCFGVKRSSSPSHTRPLPPPAIRFGFSLACRLSGSQWYFNGHAIPEESGGTNAELIMDGFAIDDVGTYVCKVRATPRSVSFPCPTLAVLSRTCCLPLALNRCGGVWWGYCTGVQCWGIPDDPRH